MERINWSHMHTHTANVLSFIPRQIPSTAKWNPIVCVFAISLQKSLCSSRGSRQLSRSSDSKQTNQMSNEIISYQDRPSRKGGVVWAPNEWAWWCRFKCKGMTAGQHLQPHRCSCPMPGPVIAVKIQNRPPCVWDVYPWPVAERARWTSNQTPGEIKAGIWRCDGPTDREKCEQKSVRKWAGWGRWILARLLLCLVSTRWLLAQLIFSRYPEQTQKSVYFTAAYERKHLWKRAGADIKSYTGAKCPHRCIHVYLDEKKRPKLQSSLITVWNRVHCYYIFYYICLF